MRKGKLLVISGPSGVGKDSIVKGLLELNDNYTYSVSATTRKKRESEKEGVDYYFLSEDEFDAKVEAGEFLEHATFCGVQYGTLFSEVFEKMYDGRDTVLILESVGALKVKEIYPDAILVFVIAESLDETKKRLQKRNEDDEDTLKKRFSEMENQLKTMPKYDYLVVNKRNKLDKSIILVDSIIKAEKAKVKNYI